MRRFNAWEVLGFFFGISDVYVIENISVELRLIYTTM